MPDRFELLAALGTALLSRGSAVALNPQPLPPRELVALNPQPIPPEVLGLAAAERLLDAFWIARRIGADIRADEWIDDLCPTYPRVPKLPPTIPPIPDPEPGPDWHRAFALAVAARLAVGATADAPEVEVAIDGALRSFDSARG